MTILKKQSSNLSFLARFNQLLVFFSLNINENKTKYIFIGKTAEVTFLSALLVWRKDKQKEQQLALHTESVDIHFRSIRGIPVGYDVIHLFLIILLIIFLGSNILLSLIQIS